MASLSLECYKRILDCTMSSHTTKQVQLADQAISEASVIEEGELLNTNLTYLHTCIYNGYVIYTITSKITCASTGKNAFKHLQALR